MISSLSKYLLTCVAIVIAIVPQLAPAQQQQEDFERAPIHYSKATANDPIAQLKSRIERGEATLEWDATLGYLPSLLKALDIPVSSQGLVFSRSSLQRNKISPKKPRAIYYGDDAYVGYVQDGMIELAGQDPTLGAVFYTIDQTPPDAGGAGAPRSPAQIVRQTDNCLNCHGAGMTVEIPGLMLRSVFPDERGSAILAGGGQNPAPTPARSNGAGAAGISPAPPASAPWPTRCFARARDSTIRSPSTARAGN